MNGTININNKHQENERTSKRPKDRTLVQ